MAAIIYTNNFWRFLLYTKVKRQLGTDLDTRKLFNDGTNDATLFICNLVFIKVSLFT